MTIQLELWQLISVTATLIIAIVTAFWQLAKMIIRHASADLERRFKVISDHLDAQDGRMSSLEGVVTELRVELARDYVKREDHVRDIGTLAAKFEALAINVERLFRDHSKETLQLIRQEMERRK